MMDDNKNLYCLRSPECPDIVLTPGDSLNLGRGPLTRISDTRVSRHHVSVILHHKGKDGAMKIEVCQLGPNHSVINKKPVYKGETSHLALGKSRHSSSTKITLIIICLLFAFFFQASHLNFWKDSTNLNSLKLKLLVARQWRMILNTTKFF